MKTKDCNPKRVLTWLNAGSVWWLLVYAIIWLSLGYFSVQMVEKQIIESLGETTGALIATTMGRDYTEADFKQGFRPDVIELLDKEYSPTEIRSNRVRKVVILDLNGKILYASDKSQIGMIDELDRARIQKQAITSEKEAESFSIIVPVMVGGSEKAVGAFEVYTDYSAWTDKLAGMRMVIWSFIFVSAFLVLAAFNVLIKRATTAIESNNEVVEDLSKRLEESDTFLSQSSMGTVSALLTALDAKDRYTARHSSNVSTYANKIGARLELLPRDLQTLETAAILHDIGKIGIPESILNKRGALDAKEFALVKRHSEIGAQIIHFVYFLEEVTEIILYHHERYDGKGYPKGLAGDEIPLTARILAVADVYDALTTDRPYRGAMTRERAREILREGSGTQFDTVVVNAFLEILDKEIAA